MQLARLQSGGFSCRPLGPADLNYFPINGQSLSIGEFIGSPGVLSTTPSSLHKMFADGPRYVYDHAADAYNVALASLVGLQEQIGAGDANLGETPCSGAAKMIGQLIMAENGAPAASAYRMLMSTPGYGATTIAQLSRGSSHFARLIRETDFGRALATAQGWSFAAQVMGWTQGESDYMAATSRAAYTSALVQLANDWFSLARGAALQSFSPIVLISQIASHLFNPNATPVMALAQTDAAVALPVTIKLSHAMYQFDYTGWHMTAACNCWSGAYFGLAYKRLIYDGSTTWAPLSISTGTKNGAVVTVTTNAASQLVFDTTWVTAQTNQGFDVVDSGGTPLTINSVMLQGVNQIVITCSTTVPGGALLRYGWRGTDGQSNPGRVTGARGNLRDSQGTTITFDPCDGNGARPMHNWALISEVAIT